MELRGVAYLNGTRSGDIDLELFDDASLFDHDDSVGHKCGLLYIVRNKKGGKRIFQTDALDLQLKLHLGGVIQRPERLVHQEKLRLIGQHHSDLEAFLHAAGQLLGIEVGKAVQLHQLQILLHQRRPVLLGHTAKLQREVQIVLHTLPAEHRLCLKHDAALSGGPLDLAAIELTRAGRRLDQSRNNVHQCCLAAAAPANDGHQLTVLNGQVDVVQRPHRSAADRAEVDADVLDLQPAAAIRMSRRCALQFFLVHGIHPTLIFPIPRRCARLPPRMS